MTDDRAAEPSSRRAALAAAALLAPGALALAGPAATEGRAKRKPPLVSAVARVADLTVVGSANGPQYMVTLEMWRINLTNDGVATAEVLAFVDPGPAEAVRAGIVRAVQARITDEVAVEPGRVSVLLI